MNNVSKQAYLTTKILTLPPTAKISPPPPGIISSSIRSSTITRLRHQTTTRTTIQKRIPQHSKANQKPTNTTIDFLAAASPKSS